VPDALEAELPLIPVVVLPGPEPAVSALVVPALAAAPAVEPVGPELVVALPEPLLADPVGEEPDPPMVFSSMVRRERQSALADVATAPSASKTAEYMRNRMDAFLRRLEPEPVAGFKHPASC
jgi:hypothetical protein